MSHANEVPPLLLLLVLNALLEELLDDSVACGASHAKVLWL